MRRILRGGVLFALAVVLGACATLGGLETVIQPPRFDVVTDRQAELRLLPPSTNRPLGGAAVRLWTRIRNPNPFGVTLTNLDGTLFMEGQRAALVDLPLGLPLTAAQDTVIPLDVDIGFADLPGLAEVTSRALRAGTPIAYRLEGQFGVDAGVFGQPTFGPMDLLQGELQVGR